MDTHRTVGNRGIVGADGRHGTGTTLHLHRRQLARASLCQGRRAGIPSQDVGIDLLVGTSEDSSSERAARRKPDSPERIGHISENSPSPWAYVWGSRLNHLTASSTNASSRIKTPTNMGS